MTVQTLILVADYTDQLSYYNDWADAFIQHPDFASTCINLHNPPKK